MELEKRLAIGDADEKKHFYSFGALLLIFLALALIGPILDGKSWTDSIPALLICLPCAGIAVFFQLSQLRLHLKHAQTEVVWSEAGIRMDEAGKTKWQIDWDQYQGVRRIPRRAGELVADPYSKGLEVLTTDGAAVGVIPGFINGSSAGSRLRSELWRNLIRELRRRSQLPDPETNPAAKPSLGRRMIVAFGGLAMLVPGFWATANVMDAWRGGPSEVPFIDWLAEGYRIAFALVPLSIGGFLLLVPICSLLLQPVIEKERVREIEDLTLTSPNLDDVRLKHILSGGPVVLEPGKRYRYIQPDRTSSVLKSSIISLWITGAMLGVAGVALLVAKLFDDQVPWDAAILVSLISFAMAAAAAFFALQHARLLPNLNHVIRICDGEVAVTDEDGKETHFPSKGMKPIRVPTRGSFRILRIGEGNRKYSIDPSHLVEVPEGSD